MVRWIDHGLGTLCVCSSRHVCYICLPNIADAFAINAKQYKLFSLNSSSGRVSSELRYSIALSMLQSWSNHFNAAGKSMEAAAIRKHRCIKECKSCALYHSNSIAEGTFSTFAPIWAFHIFLPQIWAEKALGTNAPTSHRSRQLHANFTVVATPNLKQR